MVVDFDDFALDASRLDLLELLREANPLFRCTLFAIPARGTDEFWSSVPDWCQLAVHGYAHSERECEHWSYDEALSVMLSRPPGFVEGFKAPGWQISDETYDAIVDLDWWVADHWDNDERRPIGIRAHVISRAAGAGQDPDHWHGHIPNVCGNGIEETFSELLPRVRDATSFELISEVVAPWT